MFPKKVCTETTILDEADIDGNGGRFVNLKRGTDETMVNNYHPILLNILKCNIDIQPVTGAMAIAFYIAKYMSKPEPVDIRNQIQASMDSILKSSLTSQQKINRIAMTLMKNREISAQEASFRLCHLFLKKSSRVCVFVPAYMPHNRLRMVRLETIGQDPKFCNNIIDRYVNRPTSLEELCLFEFAAHYSPHIDRTRDTRGNYDVDLEEFPDEEVVNTRVLDLRNNMGRIDKRTFPAIIKYPNFDITKDADSYFYSMLLMYLPFREENFCDTERPAQVFENSYASFRTHNNDPIINPDLGESINKALLRVTEYIAQQEQEEQLQAEIDENENFPLTSDEVFRVEQGDIVEQIKTMFATLSQEQKLIFHEVERALKSNLTDAIRLIVCGEGGTGKSYLIRLLSLLIREQYQRSDCLIISAPTGKAAFNVQGTTLHRSFALPVQLGHMGTYYRLGCRKLEEFRDLYKQVKFIFIDEFSMVNYENFRMVHQRMCEIFESIEPFANKSLILFGDLMQLKPPRGSWIFKKPLRFLAEVDLWRIMKFFELKVNHRQAGLDPLLTICSKLRVGKLEISDVELLFKRLLQSSNPNYSSMSDEFKHCTWVFPKRRQVDAFNKAKTQELRLSGIQIYKWKAKDTYMEGIQNDVEVPPEMVYKDENLCGGLTAELELGIGSRVMYRANKDVKLGIVSGAMGTVVGIEWTFGHQLQRDVTQPSAVIIKFDHMEQPYRIVPIDKEFLGKRQRRVKRVQFPLIVAFAITVHKTQGDTVEKLVLDLGKDLFAKAMAYVGVSRVKTIKGLAIFVLDPKKLVTTPRYTPCDTDALAELIRLQELAASRPAL